jgi:Flp pilus assembly protein TadG
MTRTAPIVQRFRKDRRGVAATEFAILLPVMLTLYFGVVEIAQALMVNRKLTGLTRTLADLAAQSSSLSNDDVSNIFNAAQTVMMPYTDVAPGMQIASVVIDSNRVARVCWSAERNTVTQRLGRGDSVTIPNDLRIAGTSLIMARASYAFEPTIGHLITGSIRLGDRAVYSRPRNGKAGGSGAIEQVERASFALCPGY